MQQSERTIHGVKVTLQGLQTLALPEPASSATGGSSSMRNEEKVIFDRQLEITSDGSGGLAHAHKGSKGKGKAREVQQPSVTPVSTPIHERPPELHAEQESVPAEDGIWLQKGTTGFEFSFIIPSSSPPFERHRYGRVRYGKISGVHLHILCLHHSRSSLFFPQASLLLPWEAVEVEVESVLGAKSSSCFTFPPTEDPRLWTFSTTTYTMRLASCPCPSPRPLSQSAALPFSR